MMKGKAKILKKSNKITEIIKNRYLVAFSLKLYVLNFSDMSGSSAIRRYDMMSAKAAKK